MTKETPTTLPYVALAAGSLAAASGPASAATREINQNFTIPLAGSATQSFQIPLFDQFDPSLGTLLSVNESVTGSVTWSPNADAQFLSLSILTIDARESFKGSIDGHPQVIEVNLTSGKGFSDQAFIGRGQVFEFLDSTQQLSADDGTLSGTLTGKVTYNYTPASTAPREYRNGW
jgi:hypothetical protein